ncbi:hypothetical protein ACFYWX_04290 [Streptomyces sp. NPDC002888]|uniref:hypothetical protein n=1 Tax=Streptomyces sp. NPDC002888 TaxID=3364668 RepID=UPI003677BC5B
MTTLKTERSPQQFTEELKELEHVDWPAVWVGPPSSGQALDDWCTLLGWRPVPSERTLSVETATGQQMALYPVVGGDWAPVASLSWTTWHLRADDPAENQTVLDRAAEAWTAYEAAARSVLGEPEFSGAWDDPAFPEPPHDGHWLMPRDLRLENQSPYRLAIWPASGPEGRVTVLWVNLGIAPLPGEKRGALIKVDCYPPEVL